MRTLEEVRKHLASVCYNDEADKYAIIGFLVGKGLFEGKSDEIDFASPKENTFGDFMEWFKNEEEKKYSFESWVNYAIVDAEDLKINRFMLEDEPEESREKILQSYKEIKEEKKKCIAEMDAALKELEEKANCTTDPKLQKVASCFLEFAKELRDEFKKQINA